MEQVGFVSACNKFFGRKPNQTLKEFADELKLLTPEDRKELALRFPSVGYTITDVVQD